MFAGAVRHAASTVRLANCTFVNGKRPSCRHASHYEALSVSSCASVSDIKQSYIAIARKNHPDVTDDAAAALAFQRAAAAYEVLMDRDARAQYDQTLPKLHRMKHKDGSVSTAQESTVEAELRLMIEDGQVDGAILRWAAGGSSLELLLFIIKQLMKQKAMPTDLERLLNHLHETEMVASTAGKSESKLPESTEKKMQLFVEHKTKAYNALIKLCDVHGTREDLFTVIDEMEKNRVQIDMDTYYMLEEAFQWKS